jgi:hypothetical protein
LRVYTLNGTEEGGFRSTVKSVHPWWLRGFLTLWNQEWHSQWPRGTLLAVESVLSMVTRNSPGSWECTLSGQEESSWLLGDMLTLHHGHLGVAPYWSNIRMNPSVWLRQYAQSLCSKPHQNPQMLLHMGATGECPWCYGFGGR